MNGIVFNSDKGIVEIRRSQNQSGSSCCQGFVLLLFQDGRPTVEVLPVRTRCRWRLEWRLERFVRAVKVAVALQIICFIPRR